MCNIYLRFEIIAEAYLRYEHEEKEMPRMDEHLTFAPMSFLYENGIPLEYSIGKDRSGRRMRTSADKSVIQFCSIFLIA